jgi:TPR repeat protein
LVNNSFIRTLKGGKLQLTTLFLLVIFSVLGCVNNTNDNTNEDLDALYAQGFYFSQNNKHNEAFKIMQQLAQKNYPPAVQNVALSYYHGLGVEKNIQRAEEYFVKSHQLGILDGTNELANIYYQRKNIQQAIQLWQYGSDLGDEYATYNLATYYLEMRNMLKAKELLLKAQQLGHPQVKTMIEYYKL